MPVSLAVGGVTAVTQIVGTISNVSDTKKRRLYEQNLASLSYDQKEALGKLLQKQSTEEAKLKILSETLGTLNAARINSLTQIEAEKQKTKKYLYIVLGLSGTILIVSTIYFLTKNKK